MVLTLLFVSFLYMFQVSLFFITTFLFTIKYLQFITCYCCISIVIFESLIFCNLLLISYFLGITFHLYLVSSLYSLLIVTFFVWDFVPVSYHFYLWDLHYILLLSFPHHTKNCLIIFCKFMLYLKYIPSCNRISIFIILLGYYFTLILLIYFGLFN